MTGPGSSSRFHLSGGNRRCTCAAPAVAPLMPAPARPSSNAGFHPPGARASPGRRSSLEDLGSGARAPQVPCLSVPFVMRFPPFSRVTPLFLFHRVLRVVHFSNVVSFSLSAGDIIPFLFLCDPLPLLTTHLYVLISVRWQSMFSFHVMYTSDHV
jgi:hypothetical protein